MKEVEDEEWSYIPVGGPLPIGRQPITAFGAAASLIHPATGYSLARSLREAPGLAKEVSEILQQDLSIRETAQNVWNALWPPRKRRQVLVSCSFDRNQASPSISSPFISSFVSDVSSLNSVSAALRQYCAVEQSAWQESPGYLHAAQEEHNS